MNKKITFFVHLFCFQSIFIFPLFLNAEKYQDKCEAFFNDEVLEVMSYKQSQDFVKEMNIKTRKDFFKFALSNERPENFPLNPNKVYKEWSSWEDFLGVENAGESNKSIKPKEDILLEDLGDNLGLSSSEELTENNLNFIDSEQKTVDKIFERKNKLSNKKRDYQTYNKNGKNKKWMSYDEAKVFIRSKGIASAEQFYNWNRKGERPFNLPSNPKSVYKEWKGWGEFLGTGKLAVRLDWMDYEEAKAFIQKEKVLSFSAYRQWKKEGRRPPNFPAHPDRKYKEEWEGWEKFLGKV